MQFQSLTIGVKKFTFQLMASYGNFIFPLENESDFFEKLKQAILDFYNIQSKKKPLITDEGNRLIINFNGYQFIFSYIDEDWIVEESKDIADTFAKHRADKHKIETCSCRVEFYGDDDYNMIYFNESLSLLEIISKQMKVAIFDQNNGKFFDEY